LAARHRVSAGAPTKITIAPTTDNNTVLLYSAAQGVVYGKVYRQRRSTLIGAPPLAVASELDRLWQAEWRQNR
jgi:hypothetical protein